MKKLIFMLILTNAINFFAQEKTIIRGNKVPIELLENAPLADYSIVSKKKFEELLLNGEERNHGEENHEARLFSETDFRYWIIHPDKTARKCDTVIELYLENDEVPHKIFLKRGKVLIFKNGQGQVPSPGRPNEQ